MSLKQAHLSKADLKLSKKSPTLQKKNLFEQLDQEQDDRLIFPADTKTYTTINVNSTKITYSQGDLLELKPQAVLFNSNPLPTADFWRLNAKTVIKMNSHFGLLAPGTTSKYGSKHHNLGHHQNNSSHGANQHPPKGKRNHSREEVEEEEEIPEWLDETDFKVDSNFNNYSSIGSHTYEDFEREKWQFHKQFGGLKQREDRTPTVETNDPYENAKPAIPASSSSSASTVPPPTSQDMEFQRLIENKDQQNNSFFNNLLDSSRHSAGASETNKEKQVPLLQARASDASKFDVLFHSDMNTPIDSPVTVASHDTSLNNTPYQQPHAQNLRRISGLDIKTTPQQQSQHMPPGLQFPPGFPQPNLQSGQQKQQQQPSPQISGTNQRQQQGINPPPGYPNSFPPNRINEHQQQQQAQFQQFQQPSSSQFPPIPTVPPLPPMGPSDFNFNNLPPPPPEFLKMMQEGKMPPPPPELLQLIKEGKMPPLPGMMPYMGQQVPPSNAGMPQQGFFPQPPQGVPLPGGMPIPPHIAQILQHSQLTGQIPPAHIMQQLQDNLMQQHLPQQQMRLMANQQQYQSQPPPPNMDPNSIASLDPQFSNTLPYKN